MSWVATTAATVPRRLAAWRAAASARAAHAPARRLLADLPDGALPPGPIELVAHQHELLVVAAGAEDQPVIVRLARDRRGQRAIAAHRAVSRALHEDPSLASLHHLIPAVVAVDRSSRWSIEERAGGVAISSLDGVAGPRARSAAVAALARLHHVTAEDWVVGPGDLARWVDDPVTVVAAAVDDPAAARGLHHLHRRLTSELAGASVRVARLHGDPSPENLFVDPAGSVVTGMIDWEATGIGLPEVDLLGFALAARLADGSEELGDAVVDILRNGWGDAELALLGPDWSANPGVRPTTLVLLAWLHHVATNLRKTDRYARNRWWLGHNVARVLAELAPGRSLGDADEPSPVAVAPAPTSEAPALARHRRRRQLGPAGLRAAIVAGTALGWLAWAVGAPVGLRAPLVLGVVLGGLGMALARCIAVDSVLVRAVVAGAGAVATNVVVSEVILYAGVWSPGLHLLAIGAISLVCTGLIPRYQAVIRAPLAPTGRRASEVGA
jgi:aminoglycoside phosphotransferase (APT) family kinase protein